MKIRLEFQYFEGCPNHEKMFANLETALEGLEDQVELKKVLVEDEETAREVSFRGSPTLLINGEDIEGISAPSEPSLSCRFYANGIPGSNKIREIIIQKMYKE